MNAQKRHKKKKKVPTYLIYHLPDIRRFHFLFSSAPLVGLKGKKEKKRRTYLPVRSTTYFLSFF
jgi:hypothetical protein